MDRITAILRCQWRAYWRRFRSATSLTRHNVGILVVFGAIVIPRYLQQLPLVAKQLAKRIEVLAVGDQPIPVVMPALVTKVTE